MLKYVIYLQCLSQQLCTLATTVFDSTSPEIKHILSTPKNSNYKTTVAFLSKSHETNNKIFLPYLKNFW